MAKNKKIVQNLISLENLVLYKNEVYKVYDTYFSKDIQDYVVEIVNEDEKKTVLYNAVKDLGKDKITSLTKVKSTLNDLEITGPRKSHRYAQSWNTYEGYSYPKIASFAENNKSKKISHGLSTAELISQEVRKLTLKEEQNIKFTKSNERKEEIDEPAKLPYLPEEEW